MPQLLLRPRFGRWPVVAVQTALTDPTPAETMNGVRSVGRPVDEVSRSEVEIRPGTEVMVPVEEETPQMKAVMTGEGVTASTLTSLRL